MNIQLTEEEKIKVLNGDDLYGIMQKILLREERIDRDREHFWIVGLANNNRILFIELISLGSVNATIAEPMEVFSLALQKRAVNIILVHNHPSGELKPSESDMDNTDRLIQVGKIVNLPVYDHLIISEKSYMSFRDVGHLEALNNSTKYVPTFVLEEKFKKEAEELKEKGAVLAKSEIVLNMLADGADLELISKYTGISIEEVKALGRENS